MLEAARKYVVAMKHVVFVTETIFVMAFSPGRIGFIFPFFFLVTSSGTLRARQLVLATPTLREYDDGVIFLHSRNIDHQQAGLLRYNTGTCHEYE